MGLEEVEERATICSVVQAITEHTGRPPKGWLGPGSWGRLTSRPSYWPRPHIEYVCDWCADDQPFPMRVPTGRVISTPTRRS